jgi:hypothetical protein
MHKSRNRTAGKVGTAALCPAKLLISGGSDGTRTRDLRRDRPTLINEFIGVLTRMSQPCRSTRAS